MDAEDGTVLDTEDGALAHLGGSKSKTEADEVAVKVGGAVAVAEAVSSSVAVAVF